MAQLPLPVLARAVRALAKWPFGPAVAVLPQLHAGRARRLAHGAHVDDVAGADDGFGVGAGVLGVGIVGLERLHVEGEDVLHLLHCWGGEGFVGRESGCVVGEVGFVDVLVVRKRILWMCVCVVVV